jgi:hypothetical protein
MGKPEAAVFEGERTRERERGGGGGGGVWRGLALLLFVDSKGRDLSSTANL